MKQIFSQHEGSQNCVVCSSMKDLSASGELDLGRLYYNFEVATQSEKEIAVKNHVPPPDQRKQPRLGWTSIEKVDFVLEKRDSWSAIRLQEFRRDEKALSVGPRRRLLSTDLYLSATSRASQPLTEEPSGQSRSDPSALLDFEQSYELVPDTSLRKEYRQHSKDVCVLIPLQKGKPGFAREVAERVDVDIIKLWLRRCEDKHNLCTRRNEDSYPPGLILIDADQMCLVPVASNKPVPYIALSYVWGYVSQPTLTKAVLETWMSDGQLRNVNVPNTIRDAIHLVQNIGYRYIWVDALCIVQDDAASRHAQISRMHEIYRHADMTIVAADGDNCSEGLPGVTLGKDRVYKHHRYELPGSLSLMRLPSSTKHGIEMSPWRTRGWTFQEELCSRRTLVLLPEVIFFSCASAVWREDIQLEAEETCPRSEEGLISLTSMLNGRAPVDDEDSVSLFRALVKKYMQRTLSRTDDMENAFAGVAGMLEPLIGHAYHGVPEKSFPEVIYGCWFWDASLQRRAGFPSWSWTGWIYRREQADVGIQPLSIGANTSKLLAFYKVGTAGISLLGQEGLAAYSCGEHLASMDSDLRSHFVPDEESIRSKQELLQSQESGSSNLIAFYTSLAYLRLRAPPGDFVGPSREYRVIHPYTNRQLTSICLNVAYVARKGTHLPFIVVGHNPDRQSFRLMLMDIEGSRAERVNVTAQGRFISEHDWKGLGPKRELVFMS
ncbi:hypothetical protein KVR01_010909 [Diaporthe batatas]|uniref:uncharacterized protein n=1 Tax=Diaporthe batatas TaxID=748121 RepID=UPI001D03C884|nr:uncharacterized protein KVR01_010909 [Diaporthe batatas]KAG8159248.1 hypothetical protein KVR01_010909 [Diaporthe batatas]